jgi:hypothetical protein
MSNTLRFEKIHSEASWCVRFSFPYSLFFLDALRQLPELNWRLQSLRERPYIIHVKQSVFKSEWSSAIYIDKSAGSGSTVFENTIDTGGSRSGAVVDFQGGKGHRFERNLIKHTSDVKPLRIANGVKVDVSENRIKEVQ